MNVIAQKQIYNFNQLIVYKSADKSDTVQGGVVSKDVMGKGFEFIQISWNSLFPCKIEHVD